VLIEVTAETKRFATHEYYEETGFVFSHKKFSKSIVDNIRLD
jgi:hypothetical protein